MKRQVQRRVVPRKEVHLLKTSSQSSAKPGSTYLSSRNQERQSSSRESSYRQFHRQSKNKRMVPIAMLMRKNSTRYLNPNEPTSTFTSSLPTQSRQKLRKSLSQSQQKSSPSSSSSSGPSQRPRQMTSASRSQSQSRPSPANTTACSRQNLKSRPTSPCRRRRRQTSTKKGRKNSSMRLTSQGSTTS